MSMLRHKRRARPEADLRLVYSVRSAEDVIYAGELGDETTLTYTRDPPPGWAGHAGRLDVAARRRGGQRRDDRVRLRLQRLRRVGDRAAARRRPAAGVDQDGALGPDGVAARRRTRPGLNTDARRAAPPRRAAPAADAPRSRRVRRFTPSVAGGVAGPAAPSIAHHRWRGTHHEVTLHPCDRRNGRHRPGRRRARRLRRRHGAKRLEAAVAAYKAAYPKLSDARARAAAAGADARRAVYDAAAADAATFGGAWFDPATGIVNVAATTDAAVGRAAALGKQYGVTVKAVKVKRSAAALEAGAAELRAGKDELGKAAAGNVGIDVTTNEVVVALPADRRAAMASKAAARGAKVVAASADRARARRGLHVARWRATGRCAPARSCGTGRRRPTRRGARSASPRATRATRATSTPPATARPATASTGAPARRTSAR